MQRFCTQCGSELKKEYNNCAQCGTPIKKQVNKARKVRGKSEQAKTTRPTRKERKRSIMWGAILAFVLISIVAPKWVNSHQAPERIVQKFEQAILDDDAKTIKKLAVHEDESAISETAAEAFLKLIKESAGSPYCYPI